jgi:hypothetical protein
MVSAKHLLSLAEWEAAVEMYLDSYRAHRSLDLKYLDYYRVRRCIIAIVVILLGLLALVERSLSHS